MDREILRLRILEEILALRANMQSCEHCASLHAQAMRLTDLLPPAPLRMGDAIYHYVGPLPRGHAWRFSEPTVTCMDCGVERTRRNDRDTCPARA